MTKVWLAAGYETEQVDMSARKLVFRRVNESSDSEPQPSEPPSSLSEDRHPLFGILKDVTIIVPGVDLTEPADTEWGEKALEWIEDGGDDK